MLLLIVSPKIAQQDPKRAKSTQNRAVLAAKRYNYTFKIKVISLCKKVPKRFSSLIGSQKLVLQDPKKARKTPNGAELETKI